MLEATIRKSQKKNCVLLIGDISARPNLTTMLLKSSHRSKFGNNRNLFSSCDCSNM